MKHIVHTIIGEVDDSLFGVIMVPNRGCVDVDLRGSVASLKCFYVHPAWRRKGVGTALLKAAIKLAKKEDRMSVTWTVRKCNLAAIGFYRKMGAVCCYEHEVDWVFAYPLK